MSTAVLLSGGLDSAVLLADEAARGPAQPIYVSVGLAWEATERSAVRALLASDPLRATVRPLVTLSVDMRDVYAATHWAMEGRPPGYHTPDEDVYLPGRNVVLLGKAAVYCAAAGLERLVIGTLAHTLGLAHPLTIDAPLAQMGKADVIRRGVALGVPLALSLSCMAPVDRSDDARGRRILHCGVCSKCRERHDAFLEARIADPTDYAVREYTS
jgi:7-cyano-7-deazaguanine synthase